MDEGEGAAGGRLPAELADHGAVDDGDGAGPWPDRGDDLRDPGGDAGAEVLPGLGVGDRVPAFLGEDLLDDRVAAAGADPVLAALELAEEDLAQLRDDRRLEAGRLRQRRRRFLGAAQAGDEEARRSRSPSRRSATDSACAMPASESAGLEWPSTSGNRAPTTAASEAPWRTRTTSVRARRQLVGALLEAVAVGHGV